MARPTLVNGDIWSEPLANASIRPTIDGQDNPGSIPLVGNTHLTPAPGNIRDDFYNQFYNRMKLAIGTGLELVHSGTAVLNQNIVVLINPGSIFIPASATTCVFINAAAQVASASSFPDTCVPLAIAQTDATSIVSLIDVRDQVLEQITPFRVPAVASPWLPGDIKYSASPLVPAGWRVRGNCSTLPITRRCLGRSVIPMAARVLNSAYPIIAIEHSWGNLPPGHWGLPLAVTPPRLVWRICLPTAMRSSMPDTITLP
jgi:hypothetical protein